MALASLVIMPNAEQRTGPGHLAAASYVLAASLVLLLACGEQPARAPHPTRPLGEARARALIAQVIQEQGDSPAAGRRIALPKARELQVDVTVAGHMYGIAFITAEERPRLGTGVPAPDVGSNALQLVRDVTNHQARILVLHDTNYMTDEQAGDDRDVSSVVVEHRLQRDVRDFLAEAKRQNWP